jgi:hypothetical protein
MMLPLNSEEIGFLDLEEPVGICSAQQIVAALMLHQRDRSVVERLLGDLDANQSCWDTFMSGPALPTVSATRDRGILTCLRDIGICWNTTAFYILAPDMTAARALRSKTRRWGCTKPVIHTTDQTKHWVGEEWEGFLVSMQWQQSTVNAQDLDFDLIYDAVEPPTLPDPDDAVGELSPQALMARLMMGGNQSDRLDAEAAVHDLYDHLVWWRSFVVGPNLHDQKTGNRHRLKSLQWLPNGWHYDCLYIWARDSRSAMHLQKLCRQWGCTEAEIVADSETARLLNLLQAPPIVVASWQA